MKAMKESHSKSQYKLQILQEKKAPKTAKELALIKRAQRITEIAYDVATKAMKVGMTEQMIANIIVAVMKENGATELAFSPIVAFGKNTAHIHHDVGNTKLKDGDMVMIDIGAGYKGYCSDMTRTFVFCLPAQAGNASKAQEKMWNTVKKAKDASIEALRKGERRTWVIDSIARKIIERAYGKKAFAHSLGHGVGTVIHEWPSFSPRSTDLVPPNTVMTVEPGIYKKGFGGVRLEDMVLVKKNGIEILTKTPEKLSL